MKTAKNIFILLLFPLLMNACQKQTNPLLTGFDTPFETPPFHLIGHEHYLPAFKHAIEEGLREIDAIANNPAAPDFENTIEALSYSGSSLIKISRVFYNLNNAETNPDLQEIARQVAPLTSDYSNDILFNEALFQRIKIVYDQRESLFLTTEQSTLLEQTYKRFFRNGAGLGKEAQDRLREISREMSELSLRFQDNVLAETNAYLLHITDEKDLAGLPQTSIDAAAQLARGKDLDGWAFSLQAPSYGPFMQYADNRDLRYQMFLASSTRASNGNDRDNREILKQIANLRLERAVLLGYPTHADFVLEERMAETPARVEQLLTQLLEAARPRAGQELGDVTEIARSLGFSDEIMPWDWSYYSEKLRQKQYDLDQELLRPYFELERVKQGIFSLTNKLWGLDYVKNEKIPVYHPDVDVYEVYESDGRFLAILYLDFFPREGKSPGAWMTSFRIQHKKDGKDVRPLISVVCNFSKPTENQPSLLTFNEVRTFLHEFGHALHGMFSDVSYPDLAGTSVFRDFVELPSMIMENWSLEREFLDEFAVHYQTGEKIPQDYVQKLIDARNFNAGYAILRQLGFGLLDMAWHSRVLPVKEDVEAFERRAMEPARILPMVDGAMMSPVFAHIFAGGYSAGYYSYKWSEVLDADAFELFRQNGVFDRETAAAFREHILSRGGTEHPMQLYIRFRGKEPGIDALLARDGLK